MNMTTTINYLEKPKLNNPVLIEGLPGVGNIGRVAVGYLVEELKILKHVRVILALGALAFNTYTSMQGIKGLKFKHGATYNLSDNLTLVASYHPSRQNTQTGKLTWNNWISVFRKIRNIINSN